MKRKIKFSLRMKFTLLFLFFMILVTGILYIYTELKENKLIVDKYYDYAVSVGNVVEGMVTVEEIFDYRNRMEPNAEYWEKEAELQKLFNRTKVVSLYIIWLDSEETGIYVFDILDEDADVEEFVEHPLGTRTTLTKDFEGLQEVVDTRYVNSRFEFGRDPDMGNRELASVYVPLLNDAGEVAAFVGVDLDMGLILDEINQQQIQMMGMMLILMLLCFTAVLLIVHISVLKPIRKLKKRAEQITEGKFGEELTVRGNDEISEITRVFNRMTKNIKRHMEDIEVINQAYQKYIPSKMLQILGKESITQVVPGDQNSRFVTILELQFMEAKAEMWNQDGKQVLNNTNQLFHSVIPLIMEGNGFVERFQDLGMLVFYTEGSEQALQTALAICQKMKRLQEDISEKTSGISMGIDYGIVLFGIVGGEKRMATVPLSAHTSMAKYLRQLAPLYGSRLLVTASAAEQIPGFQEGFHVRFAGMVKNRYSQTVEKVYDVFDGDPEEQIDGKQRTRTWYEKGVELFCMRQFQESRQAFVEVLKRFREDAGARRYLRYCNIYIRMGNDIKIDEIDIFMNGRNDMQRLNEEKE